MSGSTYLIPSHLRVLRQIWQGRVHVEPTRTGLRFTLDSKPISVDTEAIVAVLIYDGYAEHRLGPHDEWATVQTTDKGDDTLAALGADQDRFRDMTAAEARALADAGAAS